MRWQRRKLLFAARKQSKTLKAIREQLELANLLVTNNICTQLCRAPSPEQLEFHLIFTIICDQVQQCGAGIVGKQEGKMAFITKQRWAWITAVPATTMCQPLHVHPSGSALCCLGGSHLPIIYHNLKCIYVINNNVYILLGPCLGVCVDTHMYTCMCMYI